MKQFFTLLAAVLLTATTYAQVGINNENPDASAALDITSTTKGLLPPQYGVKRKEPITSIDLNGTIIKQRCMPKVQTIVEPIIFLNVLYIG